MSIPPKKVSAPLRMSPELLEKVQLASDRTGISQADILRLCLAIGLEDLRRIGYDLAGAVLDTSRQTATTRLAAVADLPNEHAPPARKRVRYPSGGKKA